jgi:hypothetical protein
MIGRIFMIAMAVLTIALIAGASAKGKVKVSTSNAEATVRSFYDELKARDVNAAYQMISPETNTSKEDLAHDIFGTDGSLKTLSSLQDADLRMLRETDDQAMVRANLTYSTAVGALHESKDLKLVRKGNNWQILYPVAKQENLPPQVLPVTYLRWDIIHGSGSDDWGAQNAEAPRIRITSMQAVPYQGGTIILGEIVNEDTIPAFVSVNATLLDKNNKELGQESSFDKIEHTLLPKEVTPFRIDFPKVRKDRINNVKLQPLGLLVPASADPVIGVMHQQLKKDNNGHTVLSGELVNESGQTVNIAQVLATYYDEAGDPIWVSDSYVDKALLPQIAQNFSAPLSDELAKNVRSFRVVVNHYDISR